MTLYRKADRAFAIGDRVQLTAPDRPHHLANRELGTIERIHAKGDLRVHLDSGRTVDLNVRAHPHLDYGYAVTSYSSQGQTADRVLVHIDLDRAGEALVNQRLAYVAISRGRYDAQIYTNDQTRLAEALDRDISHPSRDRADSRPRSTRADPRAVSGAPPRHRFRNLIGATPAIAFRSEHGARRRTRVPSRGSAAEPPWTPSARRAGRGHLRDGRGVLKPFRAPLSPSESSRR